MTVLERPRSALYAALACFCGLVLTGVLAELVPAAQVRDSASLTGFASLEGPRLTRVLNRFAHIVDPGSYAVLGACLVVIALMRRRRRVALIVPVVLTVAPATTEVLKHVLATQRDSIVSQGHSVAAASWPSGHATAAMTLALCAVLVAPPRWRPLVAVAGGLFTIVVSYALLVLVWHFPSDVVGGMLVAATYTLIAIAALRRWPDPFHRADARPSEPPSLWPAVALAGAAIGIALALAYRRPHAVAEHVAGHTSFVLAAAFIAALAAGLAAVLAHSARSS